MDSLVFFATLCTFQAFLWSHLFSSAHAALIQRFNTKQIFNLVSVVHNLGCIAWGVLYWWTAWQEYVLTLIVWSSTYFAVDSMNYPEHSMFRLHHYASVAIEMFLFQLYISSSSLNGRAVFWGLVWCEISNHPMYYIYHHEKSHTLLLPHWYGLETLSFVGVRTMCALYYLVLHPVTSTWLWYAIFGFWLGSLHWGWGMWKKYLSVKLKHGGRINDQS